MAASANPLGLLVVVARRSMRHAICPHARRLRLTSQQFWAVAALRSVTALTPGELGARLQLDAPAASRLVAALVARKLLEVRPDREDRRRTRLHLTSAGALVAEKVGRIADRFHVEAVRGLSEPEQDAVRAGLRRIAENLDAFGRGDDAPGEPGRSAARHAAGA